MEFYFVINMADENGNINCTNCNNCAYCVDCVNCSDCTSCVNCVYCRDSTSLNNCKNCQYCANMIDCQHNDDSHLLMFGSRIIGYKTDEDADIDLQVAFPDGYWSSNIYGVQNVIGAGEVNITPNMNFTSGYNMSFYCNLLDPYGSLNLNSYTGVITGKYYLNESFTTTIEIRWIGYDDRYAIELPIIFNNTDTSGNSRCSNCNDC